MSPRVALSHPASAAFTLSAPRLVSRSGQLRVLSQALARPPAVVLVEGEAGVGKSRLVRECLANDSVRQRRVLFGACPPYREPSTLAPIVDALRQADQPLAGLGLSPLAGALRPLFPEWADQLPPTPEPLESVTAARHRLLRALAELVGRLGTEVLVVEDAHWADDASLEFLLFLASRRDPVWQRNTSVPAKAQQLSLLVTYRPEDVPDGSLLRRLPAALPAGTVQERVLVSPLDLAATAEFAASMLGGEVSASFAEFLHARTGGLPLAVEESIRLLDDRDDLALRDGQWVRDGGVMLEVPPTVRDSTLERVQRLEAAAQHILQAAAVLGEPADEALLLQVADLAAPGGLTRAVAAGLLHGVGKGRFGFRHVLAATAVYESIPAPRRRRLHLRAGDTLQSLSTTPPATLARHFREAGEILRWCRHAERAADLAVAASDHFTAIDLLDDLLSFPELAVADRVRLVRKLGRAVLFMQVSGGDRAWQAVQTLRTVLADPAPTARQRAEVRTTLGRLLNQLGAHAEAFDELARAVPDLSHQPVEAAHVMNLLGWPRAGPWPVSTHLRWLRRAERLPLGQATSAERLGLMVDRATALLQLGSPAGWSVLPRLPAETATGQERRELTRGLLNLGDCALLWGRYEDAQRLLIRAREAAEQSNYVRIGDCVRSNLARLDWLTGRWEGLAIKVQTLVDADDTMQVAREEAMLFRSLLEIAQGETRVAEERLEALLVEYRARGAVLQEPAPAAALARLRLSQDQVQEALAITDSSVQAIVTKRIWMWAGDVVPVRVAALLAAGRVQQAEDLVSGFASGLRDRDAPAVHAALVTCRALLAQHRSEPMVAAAAFQRAVRAWDALPRPYDALLAQELRADCLIAAGRGDAGLATLSETLAGLSSLGATADVDRVDRKLRERGVAQPWRGGRRGYGDQLSPRELEVVQLVATGMTNREIARTLSKSPGTVAEQLRTAMRKLGVSSRTALAVMAVEAGMTPVD